MADLTDKNLKDKILKDINEILFVKDLDKGKISIFSMKIFYHISEYFIIINNKIKEENNNKIDKEDKIYEISGLCSDNIECMINNLFIMYQLNSLTDEEIYKMIYNVILTNVKYLRFN